MMKYLIAIVFLIGSRSITNAQQSADSFLFRFITNGHIDSTSDNEFGKIRRINDVSTGDGFLNRIVKKNLINDSGKYPIYLVTCNEKELLMIYEEAGSFYYRVKKNNASEKQSYKIAQAHFSNNLGVKLGMSKKKVLILLPKNVSYILHSQEEIYLYAYHKRPRSILNKNIPFVLNDVFYLSEFHFKNNKLVEFGFGNWYGPIPDCKFCTNLNIKGSGVSE